VTTLLLFFGRGGPSDVERRLDAIKIAIGGSVLRRAQQAGFARLIAVTADAAAARAFAGAGAEVVPPRTTSLSHGFDQNS